MKIENAYHAIATESFLFNDPVVIEGDKCRRATHDDLGKTPIFHVIDQSVQAGDMATLGGADTGFHIGLDY
jgi:hypothetical protein